MTCVLLNELLCNSYTMACPPVRRGDNPRALVSGLSYVQVDKHGITTNVFYTTYISVDLVHHVIFRAKVGMGGITWIILLARVFLVRIL